MQQIAPELFGCFLEDFGSTCRYNGFRRKHSGESSYSTSRYKGVRMPCFEWKPSFSVGFERFDRETAA
jgi:hypothetical protein